jgi:DNA (cytosine-5)-methyltransferase 1
MRHGSLFSGIGGFDLAAQWMGWENIFHCEWNEFGQKVLKHHFPKSISYADITKVDFRHHRGDIDIISGGFPCQPYSSAGKRLGKEDDRHLWPEMLRCIREVSPRWVVGENVLGLVNWNGGLVFDEVQADLEAEGFEVQPYVLPAASVNAPHRRDRVWFVAWNAKGAREAEEREVQRGKNTFTDRVRGTIQGPTINSNERNDRRAARKDERESGAERIQERDAVRQFVESGEVQRDAPDSDNGFSNQQEREVQAGRHTFERGGKQNAPDSDSERSQWRGKCGEFGEERQRRNELLGKLGNLENRWEEFPTKPPICGGDDGLPRELDGITFSKWRNESIKAYGNAIVPQVALQIFKAVAQYETR